MAILFCPHSGNHLDDSSRHHFHAGTISRSSSHVTTMQSSTLISLLAVINADNSPSTVMANFFSHNKPNVAIKLSHILRHCFLIQPFRNPYSYTFGTMCFARSFIAVRRFARRAVYVASGLSEFIFTLPFASVVVPWK